MFHLFLRPVLPLLILCLVCNACAARTTPSEEGILLIAFGTTDPEAQSTYAAIEDSYARKFPHSPLEWAFTSQKIRSMLGESEPRGQSIADALGKLAERGAKTVRAQSLHILPGEEFAEMERAILLNVKASPESFDNVYLARPLLESHQDAADVTDAVLTSLAPDRRAGEALVLMAHGNSLGRGDLVLDGMRQALAGKDPLVFMATVEGGRNFEELLAELAARNVKKVWLAPFMLVAGQHARQDMAGDDSSSWASQLRENGYEVEVLLRGLGDVPGVAGIFARHTQESEDDLMQEPRKQ